ncbi:Ig-like domain-containing protein [uncultured Vibrio sp.]|uniref:Ig-like domain-containing protein n=1 Tax=uncultured Vibrio sp. TaxID=114054 RepID=UPI0026349DF5|nr:Ig-like domain-containing protein [uncultured Vibrio sp.]
MGYYVDGSSRPLTDLTLSNWHTSDEARGYFETSGTLTAGDTPGFVTIHVTKDDITSNTVEVEITAAVMTKIQVTPFVVSVVKGQTHQFEAEAIYSDGTSSIVTSNVEWHSSDEAIATVTSEGELSGVEVGEATVTATHSDITSNEANIMVSNAVMTDIIVSPPSVRVAVSQIESLKAMALYDDGRLLDITNSVDWHSNEPGIATVTPEGELSGVNVGPTTVTATLGDTTSNDVEVTVTDATLDDIIVTPFPAFVPKGQTHQFEAEAIYSDGTSSIVTSYVDWHSEDPGTATVTSEGELFGVEVGPTTVTATLGNIDSEVNVTVTNAVITAIQVTPEIVNVAEGQTKQLTAMATYSDNTSYDVTREVAWDLSGDLNIATMKPDGELYSMNEGYVTVTASMGGVDSEPSVTVNVCDLGKVCIDIAETDDGKLYTSSPSVAYLDSIGGSSFDSILEYEGRVFNPAGSFYAFNWENANALCDTYNSQKLGERDNWRLATEDDLKGLYVKYGHLFAGHGWPAGQTYWAADASLLFYVISLQSARGYEATRTNAHFASCVSSL